MRLSAILSSPINYKRMNNYSWTRWRRQVVPDDGIKAMLEEKGIPVLDANEFVKDLKPLEVDLDALPDPVPLFPQPPERNETHPDWKEIPCNRFDATSFPVEGVAQAQSFTKSVKLKKGLPESLLELGQSTKFANEDVVNAIKQALLWDTVIQKLPHLRDLEIPSFSFKRKWGIPQDRSNERLIRNLLRICEMEFPKHAGSKIISNEEEFRVNMQRHDSLVQFNLPSAATILSRKLLKPITTNLDETKEKHVPDIFPFNSIVNFEKDHIYKEADFLAFKETSSFPFIQTRLFSHHIPGSHTHIHPRWNDDRFSGSTVLYCFATALQMAKRKFGNDVKILPEPITTQTVHFTGKEFDFAIFQLNTLELEDQDPNGLKNILWLTGKMNLYESCQYNCGRGELIGYNSQVFKNLLAFYANE